MSALKTPSIQSNSVTPSPRPPFYFLMMRALWDPSNLQMLQDSNATAAKCRGGRGWVRSFQLSGQSPGKTRADFIRKDGVAPHGGSAQRPALLSCDLQKGVLLWATADNSSL